MGRPTKYCREELLENATALFWERGYQGVSIKDLVKETGVLAGSLYSSFGNKDGVFVECLHRYAELIAPLYVEAEKVESPLGQVKALLGELLEDAMGPTGWRGCFIVNSVLEVAPRKPEIAAVLREHMEFSERWIRERLQRAKEVGELKEAADAEDLAANLFGIVYAMRIKARAGESEERIRRFCDGMTRALLGPWEV